MVKYATKLEEGAPSTVSLPLQESTDSTSEKIGPSLPMGWALKSTKTYKRLSKKQKDYLLEIFNVGNTTGHKADPAVVSKSMRRARQTSGEPMFTIDEYLTSQQIASFFSRQTAKKKKADSGNDMAAEREALLQELQDNVIDTISIRHPIMHDSHNLCAYALNNKLDRLSILLLQDICTALELDISQIKVRRKKPYLELIESILAKCSCRA